MREIKFISRVGTFQLDNPELTSYLYFPIASESGVMSSVTPTLGGDSKTGQNTFLLEPVSSENLHNNKASRNFWCKIDQQVIWSATGKSSDQESMMFTPEKEESNVEAGIMWHKIKRTSEKLGIASEILSFAPAIKEQMELMLVTVKNMGDKAIEIEPTAAIPIYGRSADNIRDHRNVTSMLHRIKTTDYGVLINPTLTFDERGHQKNEIIYGVLGVEEDGEKPIGFYPLVDEFIGEGGSFEHPRSIYEKESLPVKANYRVDGLEGMGAIVFPKAVLEAKEDRTYIICLAYGKNEEEVARYIEICNSKRKVMALYEKTKSDWLSKLNISYDTGDQKFDMWMYWVNFQPMLRRIYGCSFLPHHDYGRGGRGWRDLWQDCLALLMMNPEGVRDMLLSNFEGVRMDGSNATIIGRDKGEFVADRNNITRVWMDHGVWPFLTTHLYIMQSGDLEILLESVPYFKDSQGFRGERKNPQWSPKEGNRQRDQEDKVYYGTILEHILVEHFTAFYDVGQHNHIRLRGADWNDALDMAREYGESVAFTNLYASNMAQLADLLLELEKKGIKEFEIHEEFATLLNQSEMIYDDVDGKINVLKMYCHDCLYNVSGRKVKIPLLFLVENLRCKSEWIKKHIQETEWMNSETGHSWYNGYYDNHGNRVEGDHPSGARMMLTSQVFAIMSSVATDEQVTNIVKAVDTYLYDGTMGGYRLNTNFHEIKDDLGRMFGFAYGHKENGAVFSHMVVMYANGLYQRNYVKEGYKAIHSLYQHCMDFNKSKIYPGIPEYISENGRGMYHYLTGSASWLLLTVMTEMFGVKGNYGHLKIEPKLLLEQFDTNGEAAVSFAFAARKLKVYYENHSLKEYGSYRIRKVTFGDLVFEVDANHMIIDKMELSKLSTQIEHIVRVELV